MGEIVARDLASRGAQLVLLVRDTSSPWLIEYVNELREASKNTMIYAEECDLESLYSVRKFATKWLDNQPPRRLDMVVCCAGLALPPFHRKSATEIEGVESQYAANYLGHYHLLTLLEPALKIQPPDRDVRVVLTTCVSSVMGDLKLDDVQFSERPYPRGRPWRVFGAAKLQLSLFAYEYQRRISAYQRPDNKESPNFRIIIADPGLMRSPSFQRFASFGSLWGLLFYLILWPLWWLILKTPTDGAQSTLCAVMSPEFEEVTEVVYLSECRVRPPPSIAAFKDEELQKTLFEQTKELVASVEKTSAVERKRAEVAAKVDEAREKQRKEKAESTIQEIGDDKPGRSKKV